jgi:histidyl-tRNA synthetase
VQPLQRVKGTVDLLGEELRQFAHVETLLTQALLAEGYQALRPPLLEYTDLFARGVGEDTDIVGKEMFTFTRGDRQLTLRPEGTAGVVRAYIENGMHRWPKPVKVFYLGPMFRYERPQKGRQRQFHQLGVEVLGTDDPAADAGVMLTAWNLLHTLGVQGVQLHVNNVGTPEDRQRFKADFKALLADDLAVLCDDCRRRYETNPLRMLDCKVPTCEAHYASPKVQHFLANFAWEPASAEPYAQTLAILTALGIPYTQNPKLVRGLDYYTRTVFELTSTDPASGLGAQSTVCGGGRYNNLVETLGGPETPAVGFAFGLERLVTLANLGTLTPPPKVRVLSDDPAVAMRLAGQLREAHPTVVVEADWSTGKALGKQLKQAQQAQASHVVLAQQADVEADSLTLKTMTTGDQVKLTLNELLAQGCI